MSLLDNPSKLSLLVDIQTMKNILDIQFNKEKQKLIKVAKEYLLFLVEINKEVFNENNPKEIQEILKNKFLEVQFSFKEFCKDIKKFMDVHSLSIQFVSPEGKNITVNVTLDYDKLESFVNDRFLETTRLYFQLDHKVNESINFIERKSFYNHKADELNRKMVEVRKTDNMEKLCKIKIDIKSILTIKGLEKALGNLEAVKENHEKVVDKRLNLEKFINKQNILVEYEKLKENFDKNLFEKTRSTLKNIYYEYFNFLRKICYVQSSIKDKNSISHAKVEKYLNKTLYKLEKFNLEYSFFIGDALFFLSIPGQSEKLQLNLSSKVIFSDLSKTMNVLKSYVPSYDLELLKYFKMEGNNNTVKNMNELYSNISLIEIKLPKTDFCKVCLGEIQLILNNIKEFNFEEILEKAAGLSLYYEGLLDEIKDFETGYKELYKN